MAQKKKGKRILPLIFGSLLAAGTVAATAVPISSCGNDDVVQVDDIVIVVN